MHGSFDRFQGNRNRTDLDWNVTLFALPVLVVIALVALVLIEPAAPNWISEAAQAEFVGMNSPDIVPAKPGDANPNRQAN